MSPRIVFVTGTDTGAGKTILTSLVLLHARAHHPGKVAALKPFCSGGREDALLLQALQGLDFSLSQLNPFHFPEPLAPATAARLAGRTITLPETIAAIRSVSADLVLVEGAGGLLAPLGEGFTALDLILALEAEVIVAAANKLGVLNHTLLTLQVLRSHPVKSIRLALVDAVSPDHSSAHNRDDLARLAGVPITEIPHLPAVDPDALRAASRDLQAQLAELLAPARLWTGAFTNVPTGEGFAESG